MSGQQGKSLVRVGEVEENVVKLPNGVATNIKLDPTKQYHVRVDFAGPTDFLTQFTFGQASRIDAGTATYSTVVTQANATAGGLLGITPAGATGIKITASLHAASVDVAATVLALGARCIASVSPIEGLVPASAVFPLTLAPIVPFA